MSLIREVILSFGKLMFLLPKTSFVFELEICCKKEKFDVKTVKYAGHQRSEFIIMTIPVTLKIPFNQNDENYARLLLQEILFFR